MATYISNSPAATEALGESWGRTAPSGMVFGLCGELGAGKTQLVKGLARGLQIPERVHSPTFALVNVYSGGRLALFHLDLYRLETQDQITSAGLDEFLTPDGVTVIEWVDRWFDSPASTLRVPRRAEDGGAGNGPALPCRLFKRVLIEAINETQRRITYEDFGA